ncbi:MAG: 4'-phosphopantetheinyl transferase superfamily protein [Pseudomonadales bacterium]|nr:4'-phosphopantetheinyl transferase superfamily protein [Pseudomonadales bacterium]
MEKKLINNTKNASELSDDVLTLFFANQSDFSNDSLESACLSWLSAAEIEKHQRFHFSQHRKEYLLGQSLVRTALSEFADVDPHSWQFELGEYGKPTIYSPQLLHPYYFNLSHSGDFLVVVVSSHQDVGIDIERNTRERRIEQIAHRHFAEPEVESLLALPKEERQSRFYALWTLKEAYIKAKGMGLAIPLQKFGFDFLDATQQELHFWADRALGDDCADWQFWQLECVPDYDLAVAVSAGRDKPVSKISAYQYENLNQKRPMELHVLSSC